MELKRIELLNDVALAYIYLYGSIANWGGKYMVAKKLEDLTKMKDLALEIIPEQNIKKNAFDYSLAALLITVVENVSACIILIKNKHYSTLPVIMRATLDATVHIQNLVNDHGYLDALKASEAYQSMKMVKCLESSSILSDKHKNKLKKVSDRNQRLLNNTDKKYHKYASMANAYALAQESDKPEGTYFYSLYQFYCRDAHGNLGALGDRHFSDGNIGLFCEPDQYVIDTHIQHLAGMLIVALGQFLKHINVISAKVEEAQKIYERVVKK